MPRNYIDDGTVTSNTSSTDQQVHYLHNGTVRSKLIVLKPESTFTSESDRRHHHNITESLNGLSTTEKKGPYPPSEPGSHARLSLLDNRFTSVARLMPRKRCTRKLCLCFAVAVVSVVFGAAVGVYFGFRILEAETTKVKEFRGAFRVVSGDNFTEDLIDVFSNGFLSKSHLYKAKLDTMFTNSVLKKAYLGSEILAIDPGESDLGEDLVIRFNVRMDPSKIDVDAGDVYLVLINEIMRDQSLLMSGIKVDEDSIEVHERRAKFTPTRIPTFSNLPISKSNMDQSRMVKYTSHSKQTRTDGTTTYANVMMEDTNFDVFSEPNSQQSGSLFDINSNILESILSGTDLPTSASESEEMHADGTILPPDPPPTQPPPVFGSRENRLSPATNRQKHMRDSEEQDVTPRNQRRKITTMGRGESESKIIETGVTNSASEEEIEPVLMADASHETSNRGRPKIKMAKDVVRTRMSTIPLRVTAPPPTRSAVKGALVTLPRIVSIKDLHGRPTVASRFKSDTDDDEMEPPPQKAMIKSDAGEFAIESPRTTGRPKSPVRGTLPSMRGKGQRTAQQPTTLGARRTTQRLQKTSRRQPLLPMNHADRRTSTKLPSKVNANFASLTKSLLPFLPRIIKNRKCVPPELNLCASLTSNLTTIPSMATILENEDIQPAFEFVRSILESGCFEYAHHFICQLLQPGCVDGIPILPCRSFCESFLAKCRHILPDVLQQSLTCNILTNEKSQCMGTPECVHDLRSKGQNFLVCDGIVDCHDMSDETRCSWCKPGQFVCGGRRCIDITSRCDGKPDCPNEADERNCLALASSAAEAAHAHPYTSEGYIFLNDKGSMGKICADTLLKAIPKNRREVVLKNVGESACELLHFRHLSFVDTREDSDEVGPYFHILNPLSWQVTFLEAPCKTKQVVHVGCSNFICGKRPSRTPNHMTAYLDPNQYVALADHGDWPWHTILYNDGQHACDATLIHEQWVLTSSSCFQGLSYGSWTARIGVVRLDSGAPFQQRRRVIGRSPSPIKGSDIVLAKLESPVFLTDFVRPVCLPKSDKLFATGKKCITLGWDLSRNHLRQVTVLLTEMEECLWRWPVGKLHVFCTSEPAGLVNDCQGEDQSGGPLLCEDDTGTWYLAGMVNWRIGCGLAKQPRLYDSVAVNTNWILTTIRNHQHVPAISQEIVDM